MPSSHCYNCMNELSGSVKICPKQGFDERRPKQLAQALSWGQALQNSDLISRLLGQGRFGITYIGYDHAQIFPNSIRPWKVPVLKHVLEPKPNKRIGDCKDILIKFEESAGLSLSEQSELPEAPQSPELPDAPELPQVPEASEPPEAPQLPELPHFGFFSSSDCGSG